MDTDLEDNLTCFFVRRNVPDAYNIAVPETNCPPSFAELVPLRVHDLLYAETAALLDKVVFMLRGAPIRSCLLYARIVSKSENLRNVRKYYMDDSTGVIEVTMFEDFSAVECLEILETEVRTLKQYPRKDVADSLHVLLKQSRKQMASVLEIGNKVLIHGKPFSWNGKVGLEALSIHTDDANNSGLEVMFKSILVDSRE